MSEVFQLFECGDVFQFTDPTDSYETWQGLRGPKGDPGDPGPPGEGLVISGIVDTVGDLPASADQGEIYLGGEEAPYTAYVWDAGAWTSIGEITVGPQGPPGEDGQDGAAAGFGTPTASVDGNVGTPGVTITASGPDTAKVFAFAFTNLKGAQGNPGTPGQDGADGQDGISPEITVTDITGGHRVTITDADHPTGQSFNVMDGSDGAPGQGVPSGGTAGQVLTKDSSTDYDTSWADPEAGGINRNLLDNWYFIGGGSQSGWGIFPINQRGQTSYSSSGYTVDRWRNNGPSNTLSVESDGLSFSASANWQNARQDIPNYKGLSGKRVTISALISTSQQQSAWVGLQYFSGSEQTVCYIESNASGIRLVTASGTIPDLSSATRFYFRFGNVGQATSVPIKVIAVKLELGDAQTLAHQENGVWVLNEIPDYEEQLVQCITSHADSGDTYANRVVAYTDQALPTGGTAGQVLTKASGTDYDASWETPEAGGGALYFPSVAMTATTGTIISISDPAITADYVLASVVFSKPEAVTAGGNFSSGAGTFTMAGTCTDATCTAQIGLVKKSN